jgi:hypothetical protein
MRLTELYLHRCTRCREVLSAAEINAWIEFEKECPQMPGLWLCLDCEHEIEANRPEED